MEFKDILRELREEKEISQTELGNELHMSQRKISYLENGETEPSIHDLKNICRYFNISADYLIGLTDAYRKLK